MAGDSIFLREVTVESSNRNRRWFFWLSKYRWGHKVWMQIQEENGLTNLIYFHTDLMLALAPDCMWVSPINNHPSTPPFVSSPGLSALWQGMLSLCTLPTKCQGPYIMAEKVVPRSTTVFHGRIRNFDAPHLEGETWGSILVPWHIGCPYGGAGRGLSGMTLLCVWEMLGSMIGKILSSQWRGPLIQVWPHSLLPPPPATERANTN